MSQPDQSEKNNSSSPPPAEHRRLVRIGLWLLGSTMAYNTVEAGIALWAGVRAGSIALVGFGFDSIIELSAAAAVLLRFSVEARAGDVCTVEVAERRVRRFVGFTLLALAAYVVLQAVWDLVARKAPSESLVGIALAVVSLLLMPLAAMWKLRVAAALRSGALRAEAKETIACSYLSFCLLLGLAANATVGWWWADPAAALLMVPWLIHEGAEGLRAEGCEGH